MPATRLCDIPISKKGRVEKIALTPDASRRLVEMGLTRGSTFEIVRFAPLGDPIEIRVRGYNLSLRRADAEHIFVEALE
jgi:Fe2+ transport system protein FeoA